MPCGNLVIWRHIPVGSTFGLEAEGAGDNFNITVAVDCDSTGAESPWRHDDVTPGPKTKVIGQNGQNDSCTFTVFISVLSISGDPMCLKAWVENPPGTKIKECDWKFSEPGNFQIMINVDTQ
jgi:hypothetical protein